MGTDLHHHQAVPHARQHEYSCEKENISNFPDKCKEKLKEFIFFEDVTYVDWEATVQSLMQMSLEEFNEKYDMYMERDGEMYSFCSKDSDNPFADPNKFTIIASQCKFAVQSDPHIIVKRLGYQRGGLKPEFYSEHEANQIICCLKEVEALTKFCKDVDIVESFLENFVLNWTEQSFVMIDY